MRKSCTSLCSSALSAAGMLLAFGAQAGTLVTFQYTGACPGEIESLRIDGSQFRIDSGMAGEKTTMLYDGVERLMTTLMHDSRQYLLIEVDEDALDYQGDVATSTGNYMNKQMEKIEGQMAQQCAEMRKQGMECPQMDMRAMMQGMAASHIPSFRDLGRDGEEAGVACRWWERAQGGVKVKEECSAKVTALPIGERDRRGLERGMQVMQRYGTNMMGMMKGFTGEDAPRTGLPRDELAVAQVCFSAEGQETGRVVAKFAEQAIDAAVFEMPDGYTQLRMQ